MSTLQLGIGMACLTGIGVLIVTPFIPESPPIHVNSLSYADGNILTDRIITSDGPIFYLRRSPEIVDVKSGETIPNCFGTEGRNVSIGHMVATTPLATWTANPLCTPESLPPGDYRPQIIYRWGDSQYAFVGKPFTIP